MTCSACSDTLGTCLEHSVLANVPGEFRGEFFFFRIISNEASIISSFVCGMRRNFSSTQPPIVDINFCKSLLSYSHSYLFTKSTTKRVDSLPAKRSKDKPLKNYNFKTAFTITTSLPCRQKLASENLR